MLVAALALGRCFGVLPEARGLVTHGPYALVRHPLYLGEFAAMAGLLIASPSPRNLAAGAAFVIAQVTRMILEERALTREFPEYADYAARTPRVVPSPARSCCGRARVCSPAKAARRWSSTRSSSASSQRWSWRRSVRSGRLSRTSSDPSPGGSERWREVGYRPAGERGAILVTVVLWLPLLVLMASFVLDVANWFVHKRHLQMQADAAALAGARQWAQPACDWSTIEATARDYGGEVFNAQIGSTPADEVHMRLNSATYHNQSSPVDTTVGPPTCESAMVDVKLTETDLPWFLKAAQFVPFINAHARVSIIQADTIAGALPVGVPDPRPARARVTFIDESTGEVLGERNLTRVGDPDSPVWDNSGDPFSLTVNRPNIGVRVAVSSTTDGPFACGDPLVECFDSQSPNGSVLHIRGWSGAGTVTPADNPIARDVRLLAGTCTGAYFTYSSAECTTGIEAQIDFGTADPVGLLGARVSANLGGNQSYTLTYDPVTTAGARTPTFRSPQELAPCRSTSTGRSAGAPPAGSPARTATTPRARETCSEAQRIFSGTDARSGAIRNLRVFEITDPALDANSFEACATCAHDLVVELQLAPSLPGRQQHQRSAGDPAAHR